MFELTLYYIIIFKKGDETMKVEKRKKGSACFKCNMIKEFDNKIPSKNGESKKVSPSAICPECFTEIEENGTELWHEKHKLERNQPTFDPFNDLDLVRAWNAAHPPKFIESDVKWGVVVNG